MNEEAKLAAVFPMLAGSGLPIEELDLEVASRNGLLRSGVRTVAQLLQLTHGELAGLFPNRKLRSYSDVIHRLTCLTEPPNTAKTDGTCTAKRLPDDFWERCEMKTFNIFQVAGIWKSEEIHTRVIAELLNPNSQFHGMGTAFLEKFLKPLGLDEALSNVNAKDITVETEVLTSDDRRIDDRRSNDRRRRIDMVISTPKYYLPFEVKIWAGDQGSQLYDYYEYAENQAKDEGKEVPYIYYLTPDGHAPSDWSLRSSKDGKSLDRGKVKTLSFAEVILPWLDDCIKNTNNAGVLEIMKQLRDNIQGHPGGDQCHPGRDLGFCLWQRDILDSIYQDLAQHYNLSWTECTSQYMTCRLHKKDNLEFALRIKKDDKDSVGLYLICGITQESEEPDYALAGPYIHDNPQEYNALLSSAFSINGKENVCASTAKSTWARNNSPLCCKKGNRSLEDWVSECVREIEKVFSWLNDDVRKELKKCPRLDDGMGMMG